MRFAAALGMLWRFGTSGIYNVATVYPSLAFGE